MTERKTCTAILPLSIFPPVAWFRIALDAKTAVVDGWENFQKQTFRNRYSILGPNGVQLLSVPVKGQKGQKIPTGEIEIDYKTNWQIIHWRSIVSAYRSSPFFLHYQPKIEPLFDLKPATLLEYYQATMPVLLDLLKLDLQPEMASDYVRPQTEDLDLRPVFKKIGDFPSAYQTRPYLQVFSDRFDFIPHLSVLDLLFNEGNKAKHYLTGI